MPRKVKRLHQLVQSWAENPTMSMDDFYKGPWMKEAKRTTYDSFFKELMKPWEGKEDPWQKKQRLGRQTAHKKNVAQKNVRSEAFKTGKLLSSNQKAGQTASSLLTARQSQLDEDDDERKNL